MYTQLSRKYVRLNKYQEPFSSYKNQLSFHRSFINSPATHLCLNYKPFTALLTPHSPQITHNSSGSQLFLINYRSLSNHKDSRIKIN